MKIAQDPVNESQQGTRDDAGIRSLLSGTCGLKQL
jgi:hypothetical protein